MKKIVILNVIAIFVASCSDDSNKSESANIDTAVNIYLENNTGESLLNTDNYQSNDFKIYYLNNNNVEEVNNPLMDSPRNFFIIDEDNIKAMRLFLNSNQNEENPVTYIKWNETDTDTLKAHYSRGMGNNEDYVTCDKVWLNEELVWDTTTPSGVLGREITIVK
jgi:CMP-N-acetylneuraminic acid synthetase